jgi:hypothetical protein
MNLTSYTRGIAAAAALSLLASAASAVTVTDFDPNALNAGDSTFGNAVADATEDFGSTTLFFSANEDLEAFTSITINPFNTGQGANSIAISYAINGGSSMSVDLFPAGPIGWGQVDLDLMSGDQVMFAISGIAGASGNQVTFAVGTAGAPPILPLPAGAILLTTGLGAFAAFGRRQKKS